MDRKPRWQRICEAPGVGIGLAVALVAWLASLLTSGQQGGLVYWIIRGSLLLVASLFVGAVVVTTFYALSGLVRTLRGNGDTEA